MRTYAKLGDYAIRDVCNISNLYKPMEDIKDEEVYDFDIVLYYDHAPIDCIDGRTGKKITSVRSCYSLGFLRFDKEEETWSFESVGVRYLEDGNSIVNQWLLDFIDERNKIYFGKDRYYD